MPIGGGGGGGRPFDRFFRSMEGFDDNEDEDDMLDPFPSNLLFPPPHSRRDNHNSIHGGSNYQIHRSDHQVEIDVDLPGVSSQDVKVDVLNTPACVVQWAGERKRSFSSSSSSPPSSALFTNRLRLGTSVDCEQLKANLSRGVLRLTAPLKEPQPQTPQKDAGPNQSRIIPINMQK